MQVLRPLTISFLMFFLLSTPFATYGQKTERQYIDDLDKLIETHPDSALIFINKELKQIQSKPNKKLKAILTQEKGVLFMMLKENKKATELFFESLELFKEIKDTAGMARSYLNFGNLSDKEDHLRKAYYQQSLKLYLDLKDTIGILKSLNNLGLFHMDNAQLDSASHYFQLALLKSKNLGSEKTHLVSRFNNIILRYHLNNNSLEAIDSLKSLKGKPEVRSQERLYINVNHLISQLYIKVGESDSAISYINKTLDLSSHNFLYIRSQALKMLSRIFYDKNEYKEALKFQAKSDSCLLKIEKNNNRNLIKLLELENEVKVNNENLKRLNSEVSSSKLIRALLIALLSSTFVFSLYIFRLLKSRLRKHQAMLKAQKDQAFAEQKLLNIELQNEQLKSDALNEKLLYTKSELSSYTANFIQHNTIISDLKAEIESIKKSTKDQNAHQKLRELSIRLNKIVNRDEARAILIENALGVNDELFYKIQTKFKNLSKEDMHLLSLIMLGLSSKEIGDFYNIETQSVFTKRYRLRKKMG
ncbi:tetratricopeptide repeat protein [Croceimicrobium sp.]|uniref:tetratricopeptide repeat protein n=1 Tax=Croceimicrobium sp. TaxID=2828340 RepID=UPI003BAD2305